MRSSISSAERKIQFRRTALETLDFRHTSCEWREDFKRVVTKVFQNEEKRRRKLNPALSQTDSPPRHVLNNIANTSGSIEWRAKLPKTKYFIDLQNGVCSCPSFLLSRHLICKHLILRSTFAIPTASSQPALWFQLAQRNREYPFWTLPSNLVDVVRRNELGDIPGRRQPQLVAREILEEEGGLTGESGNGNSGCNPDPDFGGFDAGMEFGGGFDFPRGSLDRIFGDEESGMCFGSDGFRNENREENIFGQKRGKSFLSLH